MKKISKLTYFNVRGKAEAIRLLLEDNKIPYEEIRIPFDETWKTQIKPTLPFKQVFQFQLKKNSYQSLKNQKQISKFSKHKQS
jgi:hypothetical protein